MNLFQKRAALLKVAQVKSAMRHVLRGRMAKQADTLGMPGSDPRTRKLQRSMLGNPTSERPFEMVGQPPRTPLVDQPKTFVNELLGPVPLKAKNLSVRNLEPYPGVHPAMSEDVTSGVNFDGATPSTLFSTEEPEPVKNPGSFLFNNIGGIRDTQGRMPRPPLDQVELPNGTRLPDLPEVRVTIPGLEGTHPAWRKAPQVMSELKQDMRGQLAQYAWSKIRDDAVRQIQEQYRQQGIPVSQIPDKEYRERVGALIDELSSKQLGAQPSSYPRPYDPYDPKWTSRK